MKNSNDSNPNKHSKAQKLDKKTRRGVIKRLLKYVLDYWYIALIAVLLTLVSNQFALLGPKYLGGAIDAIAATDGVKIDVVWSNFYSMLLCYLLSAILSYLLTVIMVTLSRRIVYKMRKQVFERLTTLPVNYFDTHSTGDIISRISYDIDTINASLSSDVVQVLTSVYTVIGSLCYMIAISKPLILVFFITVPITIIFAKVKSKKLRPLFHKRSAALGELNGYAEEMLSGAKTIRAYGRENTMTKRFDEKNEKSVNAYYDADYFSAVVGPSVNFINNLSIALIMIMGGILYLYSLKGASSGVFAVGGLCFITIGGVSEFILYSRKFAGPINEFANILNEFQSAFAAAERVFRIIDEKPEPLDDPTAIDLCDVDGEIQLRNVSFGYTKDRTIIKDLSFDALKGQTVAIVGPTGAGKTTIINLLMRFYDIEQGEISVDGHSVVDIKRNSLRKAYTMVLQDTWLFNGTILENITYGNDETTMDEVISACKAAKIHSFIEHLPDGYNTIISDDGVNISKGQKQLITIARALLLRSPMLILDEATSNVDSLTEVKIQEAMALLMENRTCFVIAHRLSTIKNADLILVVKDGNIIEKGSHLQLLEKGGFYATLYNSQFN